MTAIFQKSLRKWALLPAMFCLLPITACMSSGTNYLQDVGSTEPLPAPVSPQISSDVSVAASPPAPIANDELYTGLPTGPSNTGTYPDLRVQPEVRIVAKPGEDVEALTNEMIALAKDHEAGRISTAAYQRRLAFLRALEKNHSADMLAQIGEPAN